MTSEHKKIIFFTGSQRLKGGTERACADIANMLSEASYEVSVLSQYSGASSHYKTNHNVKLDQIFSDRPRGLVGAIKTMWSLFFKVRRDSPDIIIFVESISFLYFIPLLMLRKKPVLVNWEHFNASITLGVRSRSLARWLASYFSDYIVVLSQADIGLWQKYFPASSPKLIKISNINPFDALMANRKSLSRAESQKRILAAGRLTDQKGFDLLIEAWAKIPKATRLGWRIVVIGEGKGLGPLQQHAKHLNVFNEIEFKGQVSDVTTEYLNSDFFVLSSRFEGFGLVLVEALSFSVPVVSFDCLAGPSEIVEDRLNGILVPPNDIEGLSKAISEMISDENLRDQLAENSSLTLTRFSKVTISKQWLELLNKV